MSPRRRPRRSRGAVAAIVGGIAVLAAVDIVLVGFALHRTAAADHGQPGPIPTFTSSPAPSAPATPVPSASATASVATPSASATAQGGH